MEEKFSIEQTNYHYYHQLTDYLNQSYESGWDLVQILDTKPSGDNQLMHRATILFRKRE